MLFSLQSFVGFELKANDGEIGRLKDVLFDDKAWTIRYFVADTGKWLPGRKVLLAPVAAGRPDFNSRTLPIDLTRQQIEDSPPIDEDAPVSRQREIPLLRHYGWATYWPVAMPRPVKGAWATRPVGAVSARDAATAVAERGDDHLRSADEVEGYHIEATDDSVGHVEAFIVDDQTWVVRYFVVDTRNWLPGRKVLVSPSWISDISWEQRKVHVEMSRQAVRDSPEYDPAEPVNRAFEKRLYDYYGRPVYWKDES